MGAPVDYRRRNVGGPSLCSGLDAYARAVAWGGRGKTPLPRLIRRAVVLIVQHEEDAPQDTLAPRDV